MSSELRGISGQWFQAWLDKDAALVDRLASWSGRSKVASGGS